MGRVSFLMGQAGGVLGQTKHRVGDVGGRGLWGPGVVHAGGQQLRYRENSIRVKTPGWAVVGGGTGGKVWREAGFHSRSLAVPRPASWADFGRPEDGPKKPTTGASGAIRFADVGKAALLANAFARAKTKLSSDSDGASPYLHGNMASAWSWVGDRCEPYRTSEVKKGELSKY